MSTQWHPLFAHLLKLLVGKWYDVEPEVPVSDLPRRGDVLVVRRQAESEPPFRGLWSHLTDWNVIEFKGPTDTPEADDLELLMAVGAGIAYRLNEQRREAGEPSLAADQVSYWYLAPQLGTTFLGQARLRTAFDYEGNGLWRGRAWGHRVWLMSYREAAVEEDALPLFLLDRQQPAPSGLTELMVSHEELLREFGGWVKTLRPQLWEEIRRMVTEPGSIIDWVEVAKVTDLDGAIRVIPPERVIEILGVAEAIRIIGLGRVIEELGLTRVLEVVSLARIIEEVGLPHLIDVVGLPNVLAEVGPERLAESLRSTLSPEQLQEIVRRLQQPD